MLELVNTSLPNGLIAGTHGFATVAMTKGLPDALRRRLEALCAYTHKTSAHDASYYSQNPVNWFHAVLPQGEHVVGRVAASDFDYTGRTNRLARLLIFPGREMPAVGGAAILQAESARLSAPWSGEPRHLPADKEAAARLAALQPPAFSSSGNWTNLFGPDGAQLAQRFAWQLEKNLKGGGKPIYFKTSAAFDQSGTKLLGLFADIVDLLPAELRASVTFSTYPDALPAGTNCLLRGAFDGDRNFAIASSTQPWVDCEHAKVVHPEMLPSEAEPKPAATISGKWGAPTALDAAAPQSLDSPHAAPKRKQHPSGTPRRSHGAGSPYLLPPRSDDKKSGINVPACVVMIPVLVAAGFFVFWKVGEKKKPIAEEAPQQQTSNVDPVKDYGEEVDSLVVELKDMKDKIKRAETFDEFEQNVESYEKKENEARDRAKAQGASDGELQTKKDEFENMVSKVRTELESRERVVSQQRDERAKRANEANARADAPKDVSESKPEKVIAETDEQGPTEPADTRPAFCRAETWKPCETFDKVADCIKDDESVEAFYYSTANGVITLTHEKAASKKKSQGLLLSPNKDHFAKQNSGLFIIFFSTKKNVAYWLWTCSVKKDKKASQWFDPETNGKGIPPNLRELAFGSDPLIYDLYVEHFGTPEYTVKCSPRNDGNLKPDAKVQDDSLSIEAFAPSPENQNNIEMELAEAESKLTDLKEAAQTRLNEIQSLAETFTTDIQTLKEKITDIAKLKEKNKETKEVKEAKNKLADKIVADFKQLSGQANEGFKAPGLVSKQPPNERDLKQAAKAEVIDEKLKEHMKVLVVIGDLTVENYKGYADAQTKVKNCRNRLNSIGKHDWREDAQKAEYWISSVKGSKESGKARR